MPRVVSTCLMLLLAGLPAGCTFEINQPAQFKDLGPLDGLEDSTAPVDGSGADVADARDVPDSKDVPDIPGGECQSAQDCAVKHGPPTMCMEWVCVGNESCKELPTTHAPCDDGDACTVEDSCTAQGECEGAVMQCPVEPDPCFKNVCMDGECEMVAVSGCMICHGPKDIIQGDPDQAECCEDEAHPVPYCKMGEEGGCGCQGDTYVCRRCGDGSCDENEDWCICPEDCPPPVDDLCTELGGYCVPEISIPEEPACEGGYQVDPNMPGCQPGDVCCMPGGGCDTDEACGPNHSCQNGQCVECFAEVCNNGLDDDCDGDSDENNCVPGMCGDAAPEGFQRMPLHVLAPDPSVWVGTPVATGGRAANDALCLLGTCNLLLKDGPQNSLVLSPSQMQPVVNCDGQVGTDDECYPLDKNKHYVVWGTVVKGEQGVSLSLEGFCPQ